MLNKRLMAVAVFFTTVVLWSHVLNAADDDHVWIHVDGNSLKTSASASPANQEFVVVGVASSGAGAEHNQALVEFCKNHNFNTVRFGMATHAYSFNADATWDMDSEIQRLRTWVDLARQHGIYTIFDNHDYFGFRDNQYWDSERFEQWKSNYVALATEFKDEPWVLGYELMNELFNRTMTLNELKTQLYSCASRIRAVDTKHIIFIADVHASTPFWENTFNPADFDVLNPPQVALTPHMYPASEKPGDYVPDLLQTSRQSHNVPVVCSEFNAGTMGNGYTYDHNKRWLGEFLGALKQHKFGWIIWYHRPSPVQDDNPDFDRKFSTVYSPDDPEIFRPYAYEMFHDYPIPSSGNAAAVVVESPAGWFGGAMLTDEEIDLTIRIVDGLGTTITNSNASISLNASGEGSLINKPSNVTNGKATVTLKSTSNPGTITVTASSSGVGQSGELSVKTNKLWDGFQLQLQDATWVDASSNTDDSTPRCRVGIKHPTKGVNKASAYYEYTTDGGSSWIWWDSEKSDEFDQAISNGGWSAENHNSTGGSADVVDGKLVLKGEGRGVWSTWQNVWYVYNISAHDEFACVHKEMSGEFEVVTKVESQQNTNPWALAGIFARDNMTDSKDNGYCYVAVTPGNGFVFAWKDLGHMNNGGNKDGYKYIDARKTAGSTTYPCWLKLRKVHHPSFLDPLESGYSREYSVFSAYYSTDGENWHLIKSRLVFGAASTQRVGLLSCSNVDGTFSEAKFDYFRTALKAQTAEGRYSTGRETLTTGQIPFDHNTDKSQKVRFRILSAAPFDNYMNSTGEEFVSPEYTVVSGVDVAAANTAKAFGATLALRSITQNNGLTKIGYSIPEGGMRELTFTVVGMNGATIWTRSLGKVAQGVGTLEWNGTAHNGAPVAAGAYFVRMETRRDNKAAAKCLTRTLMHLGK